MKLATEVQLGLRGSLVSLVWIYQGFQGCNPHQYPWVLHMSSDTGVAAYLSHADCDTVQSQALAAGHLSHSLQIQCCF